MQRLKFYKVHAGGLAEVCSMRFNDNPKAQRTKDKATGLVVRNRLPTRLELISGMMRDGWTLCKRARPQLRVKLRLLVPVYNEFYDKFKGDVI